MPIVADNTLVHGVSGLWRAFAMPYWPPAAGGYLYRPLVVATYALAWLVAPAGAWWFHGVNVLWHAGASTAVALLARRSAGDAAGWLAGVLFAVHPVHVEAVANVVGRAELMAAVFSVVAVYAALARWHAGWSAAALAFGLLSKENAAVAPALVVWAWMLGLDRPDRRRMVSLLVGWVVVGVAYAAVRTLVRQPFGGYMSIAPMFIGKSWLTVRLTAVAALADVARLLVFPLALRAGYSPNQPTLGTSPLDLRFATGLFCALVWVALLLVAWTRGRKLEAFGLGWIGVAFLPVANFLYPDRKSVV